MVSDTEGEYHHLLTLTRRFAGKVLADLEQFVAESSSGGDELEVATTIDQFPQEVLVAPVVGLDDLEASAMGKSMPVHMYTVKGPEQTVLYRGSAPDSWLEAHEYSKRSSSHDDRIDGWYALPATERI